MLSKIVFKNHSTVLSAIAKLVDVLLYFFASILALYKPFAHLHAPLVYKTAILIAILSLIPIFSFFGVYESLRGRTLGNYLKALIPAFMTLMLFLAALAFITKTGEYFSRSWFLWWHFYAAMVLIIFRISLREILKFMRKQGANHKRVVIIGYNDFTKWLVSRTKDALWVGFDIIVIFASENINNIKTTDLLIKKIPQNINEYIQQNHIDEVWIIAEAGEVKGLDKIIQDLSFNIVTVRYFPAILNSSLVNHSLGEILGFPVINVISSPMLGINRFVKAIEDRILAALILLLISPIFLCVAGAVKLSSKGPIFYRQRRVGWNGKEFDILKFRSMPIDAESKTGAVWASKSDNRSTKVGAFLRKTSLDELPQFINVLKGEMSIVGPRPERPVFVDEFKKQIPNYMQKHLVKAGITGWAQVNGWRGSTSLKKRIEFDIYYINHWSLWFDLKIIFLTLFKGFINKNAY